MKVKMDKQIGIGTEFFHKLIEENKYYVDKTMLLRTVFQDNGAEVLLITRPRRFGKTLTMSTFHDFLALNPDNPEDLSRQELWFKDTAIFSDREFCRKYMGRFPVIFISLKYNFPNCIAHPSSYSTLFFFGRPLFFFGAF